MPTNPRTGRLQESVLLVRQMFSGERELGPNAAACGADHSLAPDPAARAQIEALIDYTQEKACGCSTLGPAGTIRCSVSKKALTMKGEDASRALGARR